MKHKTSSHKMAKLLGILTLGLALHAAPASASTTFNIGELTSTFSQPVSVISGASFEDVFNFHLGSSANTAYSSVSLNLSLGGLTFLNISNLGMALYNGSESITPLNVTSGNPSSYTALLGPGDYSVHVTGNATGLAGGNYLFALTAQPVPEPESWAMFLAGLMALGAISRRRMSSAA